MRTVKSESGQGEDKNAVVRYEAVTLSSGQRFYCGNVAMITLVGDFDARVILPNLGFYLYHYGFSYTASPSKVELMEDALIMPRDASNGLVWHTNNGGTPYVNPYYAKEISFCVGYYK